MRNASGERKLTGIENLEARFQCLTAQISSPTHHAFIGQFSLPSMVLQPESSSLVITIHEKDARIVDLLGGKCFREKSDTHLPLKQDGVAVLEDWHDPFQPGESHSSLPRTSWIVTRPEGRHDLRRWNANRIEAKDLELGIQPLDFQGDRRLAAA